MSVGAVLRTAVSGISAAEMVMRVVANNLANSQTAGFKASSVAFATQTPRTLSSGARASGSGGGGNPMQVGSGVLVAGISGDFSQGTITLESGPTSVAIQGEGFFILEGAHGERLYGRDGRFSVNANGELVSVGGYRVMGYGVDENSEIERTELVPLTIPQGSQAAGADGSPASLGGVTVTEDGRIRGRFSDGVSRDLGEIQIARFANPSGLERRGDNLFAPGVNSGLPMASSPGEAGTGELIGGAVELSNVDVGQGLVDLLSASTQFRANVRVLEAGRDMLDALMTLRRSS